MEELQEIWTNMNKAHTDLQDLLQKENLQSVISQFEKSERARRTTSRWTIPISVAILAVMTYAVVDISRSVEQSLSGSQWLGAILLIIGLGWMSFQFRYTSISPLVSGQTLSTVQFMRLVKKNLLIRKKLATIGPVVYTALLIPALHLLLFDFINIASGYNGLIGLLYGSMLAVMGYIVKTERNRFDKLYGNILEACVSFEDDSRRQNEFD